MIFIGEGNGPGCFMVKNLGLGTKGRAAVLEFQFDTDGSEKRVSIPYKRGGGVIITGISTNDSEGVSHLQCFGDKIYTYAFGAKPGSVTIQCIVFMGAPASRNEQHSQYLRAMMRAYKENRISKSLSTVRVVFPSTAGNSSVTAIRGNLVGMQTSTKDPDLGIQNVTLSLITTEPIGSDQ